MSPKFLYFQTFTLQLHAQEAQYCEQPKAIKISLVIEATAGIHDIMGLCLLVHVFLLTGISAWILTHRSRGLTHTARTGGPLRETDGLAPWEKKDKPDSHYPQNIEAMTGCVLKF